MRRILARFALVLGSILMATVLLEITIRVFDPLGVSQFRDMMRYFNELCEIVGGDRILRHRPNTTVSFHGFEISTDRLGLRGAELSPKKPDGEFRLLFLGDSVTLGWGARREDLFVTRVERELNDAARAGQSFRCINTGHNQFDTWQEAALLDELGDRIDPDAVLLVYVGNDVVPTIRVYEQLQSQPAPGTFARIQGWLLSVPFAGLHGLSQYLRQSSGGADAVEQEQRRAALAESEGWRRSREALERVRDWCRKRRIPFLVLDHTQPATEDRRAEVPPLAPFLEESAIDSSPFHFTPAELGMPIRHSASDPHANALGHEFLAKKLRRAIGNLEGLKVK